MSKNNFLRNTMIYKHKKKDYLVFEIESEYLQVEENFEIAQKLQLIHFKNDRGQYYVMYRQCFNNEYEKQS